ncbi:sphingomyelin phosphodiesterase [Elysia marginata]|uniref:Sphingomyelin phosphodiesterase n=1 Tax=Elysia marginata TaxID=1093978 RepID=A0AAV4IVS5_9GAST|nr:sphingomyelin phosphodiesterase [Elysia marginata]
MMMHDRRRAFCAPEIDPENDGAFIACDECKGYVDKIKHVLKHETNQSQKHSAAYNACHKFLSMFGHNPEAHCPELLDSHLESIELVIHVDKLPDVCNLLGLCPDDELDASYISPGLDDNHLSLDNYELLYTGLDDSGNDVSYNYDGLRDEGIEFPHPVRSEQSSPNITFVQISDIHFDPAYAQGRRAGPFGDFNCDAAERAVKDILDFTLTLDPVPDFFVYVGDSSYHALLEFMWEKIEDNRDVTKMLVEKLRDTGPIYPVFGNHAASWGSSPLLIPPPGTNHLQEERVIFTSHMRPRYGGTYPEYADYVDSLLAEFSDVIILQLYGHEHDDSFLIHRDPGNSSRVVGTSLSAPSVTPFFDVRVGVNPAIRVFTLERDTWSPLDYTQYYVDLEEANRDGSITMKVQYQFTEEYGLPDMSPDSFAALSERVITNWSDFQKYESNFQVLTNGRDHCSQSDLDCRRKLACHTRTADPSGYAACLRGQ